MNDTETLDVEEYLAKWVPTLQRAVDAGSTFTMSFGFDGDYLALHLATGYEADRFGEYA